MTHHGRRFGIPARVASVAFAAAFVLGGAGLASASTAASGPPRTLAVSTPPDATAIAPGQTGTIPVRVVNAGAAAVVVSMSLRGITLGDDGQARIASEPDPRWLGRVDFPKRPITIAAHSYVGVPVKVQMPSRISADLYFVGFVVTPEASTPNGIAVVNQIGSFFTIDVPGARSRRLSGVLVAPKFVLGSVAHGTVRVRNVGRASAQFWGENDTTASPGSDVPVQQRIDKQLLPIGASRSYAVSGKSTWPIGIVSMKVHIVYPDRDGSSTTEIVATSRVLVADPIGCAAAIGVVIVVAVAWSVRRRRRPRRANGQPRAAGRRSRSPGRAPRTQGRARPVGPRGRGTFEDRLRRARSTTGNSRRD